MRILHTADWHLGRSFHGESLLAAQAAAIDHTVETARAARVGAVVLAGDVYDRALPPVDAVRLADEALRRLSEICPVVVISGNHDSAPRLGFGSGLLARAGLHLRTDPRRLADPVVLAGGACIYGIPYLEPDLARGPLGCDGRGHGAVLDAAMGHVRADLARRPAGTRAVVVAHAFVAGAEACESERDLAVGGAASVSAATFAGADYVALGHLHGPQRIGSRDGWARYSGSPVAFSFSEARHRKSLALVDLDAREIELAEVPVTRPLAVLRGTLDSLLTDPALANHERAWVQATVTDPVRPADAMERLRRRFPNAVLLAFEPEGGRVAADGSYAERLRGLDDAELLARFVRDVRGAEAGEEELALLSDALTAGRVAEVSG
ncbi:MAG: repair protein SbcD/Mre11 [Solirubrobacteraceae bacterium]|jgi:exonuclease SbcD|nr:repair protein SbcD/Mre11 [Solirubrobacteraceae bacterium]